MTIGVDDLTRDIRVAHRDAADVTHIALVGDTYSVLIDSSDTNGRYCLMDMEIPDGGGPPPHRHDFEEMFTVLEGSVDFTFRGRVISVDAGTSINIPARAPHFFRNNSGHTARMLCMCTPSGQEEFFAIAGDVIPTRKSPAPDHTPEEILQKRNLVTEIAAQFRSEMLN